MNCLEGHTPANNLLLQCQEKRRPASWTLELPSWSYFSTSQSQPSKDKACASPSRLGGGAPRTLRMIIRTQGTSGIPRRLALDGDHQPEVAPGGKEKAIRHADLLRRPSVRDSRLAGGGQHRAQIRSGGELGGFDDKAGRAPNHEPCRRVDGCQRVRRGSSAAGVAHPESVVRRARRPASPAGVHWVIPRRGRRGARARAQHKQSSHR